MDNDTRMVRGRSVERRQNAVMITATADAATVSRVRAADPATLPWDAVVDAAVATAADLTARSGYRPDHHTYLAGFFATMAQATTRTRGHDPAHHHRPADSRQAAADLGARIADRVDDPTATLTSSVDRIRDAVDTARRLATDGREPEAWSLLAGYTGSLGDRITDIHLHAGPIAAERAMLVADDFVRRRDDPSTPADTFGDPLGL